MDTTLPYYPAGAPVNWAPLRGRYLSRALKGKREAAFAAADLYSGAKVLVEPSLAQAALIAGSETTSVWWALQREKYRAAIIAGELPLVPTRTKAPSLTPKTNGNTLPVVTDVNHTIVVDAIAALGVERVLDIAAGIEAARQH